MRLSLPVIVLCLLSACTQVIEAPYTPASVPNLPGKTAAGTFSYHPAEGIGENQISFGIERTRLLLDRPVAQYLQEAATAELTQAGAYDPNGSCALDGEAHRFHLDNSGFTVKYSLDVTYALRTGKDASAYRKTISTVHSTPNPFRGYGSNVAAAVGKNFSALLADPELTQALAAHCASGKPAPAAQPE